MSDRQYPLAVKMPSEASSWKHNIYAWLLDAAEMMVGAWIFLAVVHFVLVIFLS